MAGGTTRRESGGVDGGRFEQFRASVGGFAGDGRRAEGDCERGIQIEADAVCQGEVLEAQFE